MVEIQGEPEEVVIAKLKEAIQYFKTPVLIEDTSLCFNAFGGMPGPYIKWYLKKCGKQGIVTHLAGVNDKSAYALSIFGFLESKESEPQIFIGRCDGTIVSPRGNSDFDWDPCFQPENSTLTFAEMNTKNKMTISHRGMALNKLKIFLISWIQNQTQKQKNNQK